MKKKRKHSAPRRRVNFTGGKAWGRLAFSGIAVCAVCAGAYFIGFRSNVQEGATVQVSRGVSISSVADKLKSDGFIFSADVFKGLVLIMSGNIQAGEYDLPAGASVWKLAKMFSTGDIASTTIVIPEGLTVKQIIGVLKDNKSLSGQACTDKDKIAKTKIDDVKIIQPTEITENLPCPSDGELFPDTYRVAKGTSRAAVIDLMRTKMSEIKNGWEKSGGPAPAPLKTWNEVITLASIVQKETPKESEMPVVASVYLNRLRRGMKLQADPTVVYAITNGLGDMHGKTLWSNFLKRSSPYNTYTNYGLPPSPIANVGRAAISAVLAPADTNYLFFVADGTGGHNFARDLDEHNENRKKWRIIKAEMNK